MSTVYVLGAGASRAESPEIPLVADFLEKAFQLGKFMSADATEFINSLANYFGLSIDELRKGTLDIEQLFSLIDSDIAWERLKSETTGLSTRWLSSSIGRSTLEGLIGGVLFHVVPPVFAKEGSHHKRLGQVMQKGDSVISFNYDLIADWTLKTCSKFTVSGYAMQFSGQLGTSSASIETLVDETSSQVSLLKLHGSLNWLQDARGKRQDLIYLKDAFEITLERNAWGPVIELREDHGKQSLFRPFVVPPSADKSTIWAKYGGVLRPLWEKAGEVLKNCDRLVIVGYSLREADYQSQWLFRRFLAEGNRTRKICIVNTNQQVRCRLRDFFGGLGQIEEHHSFEDFAAAAQ